MPELDRPRPRLTSIFDNDILHLLEGMRINASRRLTNRAQGEHLVHKGGSSHEFEDYRNYVEGDDIRFVDWNVFARLNRPYMKTYRHEEELHVVLLLDASASMGFDSKFALAQGLAAAFGVMGLLNGERVSCWPLNARNVPVASLAPCRGRVAMRNLLSFIETISAGGDITVDEGIEQCLRRHRGRGIAIICSDFLSFGDVSRAFSRLFSAGLEIMALQILSPSELAPALDDDVRLIDCEDGQVLDVSGTASLLDLYHEYRTRFTSDLAAACRARGGRFLSLSAAHDLRWVLCDRLRRRGWIR